MVHKIAFWISISLSFLLFSVSLLGQRTIEEERGLTEQLPANTLVYVNAPNLSQLLQELSETGLGQAINEAPVGIILRKALIDSFGQSGPDSDTTVSPKVFEELSKAVGGRMTCAIFPDQKNSLGFLCEFTLAMDHPFVDRLNKMLLSGSKYGFSKAETEGSRWTHYSGFDLSLADGQLVISNNSTNVDNWLDGRKVGIVSNRSFSTNRKWLRISKNLDLEDSAFCGFVDTGRLIDLYVSKDADRKVRALVREIGMLDALAAGFVVRLNEDNVDLLFDAFVLCAIPRRGIWSALSLAPLDSLDVPHCPSEVGYALVGNSNLKAMVRSIGKLEAYAESEHGISKDEFMGIIAEYVPPLVFPLYLRDEIEDLFTGEFFVFGEARPISGWWHNGLSVGVAVTEGKEDLVEALLLQTPEAKKDLVERTNGEFSWWVESDESRRHNVELIKKMAIQYPGANLSIDALGKVAFVCDNQRFMRFASEKALTNSIRISSGMDSGIEINGDFLRVKKRIADSKSDPPSLVFFLSGEEMLKWPHYKFVGPGKGIRDEIWKSQLEQGNRLDDLSSLFKKAILEHAEDWDKFKTRSSNLGCIGGAFWDQEAGFALRVFMLRSLQSE